MPRMRANMTHATKATPTITQTQPSQLLVVLVCGAAGFVSRTGGCVVVGAGADFVGDETAVPFARACSSIALSARLVALIKASSFFFSKLVCRISSSMLISLLVK